MMPQSFARPPPLRGGGPGQILLEYLNVKKLTYLIFILFLTLAL